MIQDIELNKYQTSIIDLNLEKEPKEVQEQFWDFFWNVPFIQTIVSKDRKRAKDLPKDETGKIIVDITQPHILEDMDYFRQPALHFIKTGKYTDLRPNPNPNSEYGKWITEEVRRCNEGYVRESDGEWIPGDLYFMWNYTPMLLVKKDGEKSKKGNRVLDFPKVWDGHYLKFHYLKQARDNSLHAVELASRQKGKSFSAAAMLAKRFVLGESGQVNKKVTCYATAAEKKYLVAGDQTLDKFQYDIDFLADNTEWPRRRLINTIQNMQWTMGYQDLDSGTKKGTLNSVIGVTAKDDESKLRGTRGVLYIIEEAGSFPRLLDLWNNMIPSVMDGDIAYGLLYAYGTAGDSQSDFYAMSQLMYQPEGYKVYSTNNVYDIYGKGGESFSFFFPGYMNHSVFYDENGNSDVTAAILYILKDRYKTKHTVTDVNTVVKRTAEIPITPQEAIIKSKGNIFPIADINERIMQLDSNPNSYDDVYVGKLIQNADGTVDFKITSDTPIRNYPLNDNRVKGAVEIFRMPERDSRGKIPTHRYIASCDPVDSDIALNSTSLSSTFVFDLFTDSIVAEYTGRNERAEENYEVTRRLCLFYNAQCLYESNIKGMFSYFSKMSCSYLLADTPEYLRERELIKSVGYGNVAKGVHANPAVNNHANELINTWLGSPKIINENDKETTITTLFTIKNRALLKELSVYNPNINVDRIRSLGLLMIFREQFLIKYQGDINSMSSKQKTIFDDPFFKRNSPYKNDDEERLEKEEQLSE